MQQTNRKQPAPIIRRAATTAALAILAGVGSTAPAQHQQGDAVTLSWSGATFMRSFTTSRGITLLTPGTSITLNAGPGGVPVTFDAPSGGTTNVQLAAQDLNGVITPYSVPGPNNAATANYYAIRFEWHEQGSIEGMNEMINDQVGLVSTVVGVQRNASAGNPSWVNSNGFGVNGANVVPQPPTFSTVTINGHNLSTSNYNTNFGGNYDDTNPARPGRNVQGGQNRVQLAVSDVNSVQGLTGPSGTPAYFRVPGNAGYGKGNPNLPVGAAGIQGLGNAGVRHEFNVPDIVNMPTSAVDPTTGNNYSAGPWNTAGNSNLDNNIVAVGGLAYVANSGTGLERINRTDGVWLQSSGRLQNGADFNSVSRDAYSGTVNSATNNMGLDTSWATGENDDGNTGADNLNALAETRVGSMKFSGKTSGSSAMRPTIQNGRMTFGHLSSSDAIPAAKQSNSRPMRVLMYRDDADDFANGSNNLLPADLRNNQAYADPITGSDGSLDIVNGFTRLTARSIVEGSYESRTNQTYITVKAPNLAFAGDTPAQWAARTDLQTGIKGDNSGNDVADMRANILQSVANFPAPSVANPADQLLQLSFMLPQLAKFSKDIDGLNRDFVNPNYNAGLSNTFLGSPLANAFNADSPETVTTGTNSNYGNNNVGNGAGTPAGGNIRINNGNWLFGDFDQRATNHAAGVSGKGVRDFSDLTVAQQAQAALETSGLGNDWNAGSSSNTTVAGLPAALNTGTGQWSNAGNGTTPTKGDLIVLGDFNSDGKFDGKDLYRMARGTSLATSIGTATLGGDGLAFADSVRRGVLRKNAALDLMNSTATPTQKVQASSNVANDPTGALAFDKVDVNRDGLLDLKDAKLVDFYCGKFYTNLDHSLAATQGLDGDSPLYTQSLTMKPIDLVDVELNDTGKIDTFDFGVIRPRLSAVLKDGDTDFNGVIDGDDYARIDFAFNVQGQPGFEYCWSNGDFDSNATIDGDDYFLIDNAFNTQRPGAGSLPFGGVQDGWTHDQIVGYHINIFGQEYIETYNSLLSAVPEPASATALLAATGALMGGRRRRRRV
jgi:hypothetical protein